MSRAWVGRYRRPLGQFTLLIGEKGCRMLLGSLVGVLVARSLGPADFGQLSLALSLAFLASPLARLGLEEILIRDVTRSPALSPGLIGTAMALRGAGGLLLLAAGLGALTAGLAPNPLGTALPILLFAFLVQLLDTPLAFLLAVDRAGSVASARLGGLLAGSAWRLAGIAQGAGVAWFAFAYVAESVVQGVAAWRSCRRANPPLPPPRFEAELVPPLVRQCGYVTALHLVYEVTVRADVLILALFTSGHDVGVYAFAMRFVEALYTLPVVAGTLVLPRLARCATPAEMAQLLARLAAAAAVGFGLLAAAVAALAGPVVGLLGGETYAAAGPVLAAAALGLPFTALGILRYHYLIVLGRARTLALLAAIDAAQTIALTVFCSWHWGILGAAWAHGASRVLNMIVAYALVEDLRRLPAVAAR